MPLPFLMGGVSVLNNQIDDIVVAKVFIFWPPSSWGFSELDLHTPHCNCAMCNSFYKESCNACNQFDRHQ